MYNFFIMIYRKSEPERKEKRVKSAYLFCPQSPVQGDMWGRALPAAQHIPPLLGMSHTAALREHNVIAFVCMKTERKRGPLWLIG